MRYPETSSLSSPDPFEQMSAQVSLLMHLLRSLQNEWLLAARNHVWNRKTAKCSPREYFVEWKLILGAVCLLHVLLEMLH